MKRSLTAAALSLAVAAATCQLTASNAFAEPDEEGTAATLFQPKSKAQATEPTEKTAAPTDATSARQVVVEPTQDNAVVGAVDNEVEDKVAPPPAPEKPDVTQKHTETEGTGIDENLFAPQTTVTEPKVEVPTVFTDKQKGLFSKLTAGQQRELVEKLVKKYGYDTMYPKKVTRKYLEDYRKRRSRSYDEEDYSSYYGHDHGYGQRHDNHGYGGYGGGYKYSY